MAQKGYNHSYQNWWKNNAPLTEKVYNRSERGQYENFWNTRSANGYAENFGDVMNPRSWRNHTSMTSDQLDIISRTQKSSLGKQSFLDKKSNAPAVKSKKHPAGLGKMGWGFVGVDTVMNMKAGDSFGTAATKGIVSGMLWTSMPGIMTAHMLATSVPGVVSAVSQYKRSKELWWNQAHRPSFGGQYQDTRRAQTMRQAAVEAIQGSKLNARSALGGEARILNQNMYRG